MIRPTSSQRHVLQRLRTDAWQSFASIKVTAGEKLLDGLAVKGWIERRGEGPALELKLTSEGLDALRAKIPEGFPSSLPKRRAEK